MNQAAKKRRILFVDDSHTEVKYLKMLIEMTELPLEAAFVHSASEGLQYLEEISNEKYPEIIMVDINMPLMNGFEFSKIYEQKFLKKNPKSLLYIYSTSIDSSEISKAKSMKGVVDFIAKPFDENTFYNIIQPKIEEGQKLTRPC